MSLDKEPDFDLSPEIMEILLKANPNVKVEDLSFKNLNDVWEFLKKEESEVDSKLNTYKSHSVDLHDHMELLHQYNDIKDITQQVLGALANVLKISVSEAHHKFALEDSS